MPTKQWSGVDMGGRRVRAEYGNHSRPELRLEAPCDGQAPAAARDALRQLEEALRAPPSSGRRESLGLDWVIGDAVLVASELVTDAVLHSGCGPRETLVLEVSATPGQLLISVHASDATARPASGDPSKRLGLRIVQHLSRRWGSADDGRRLWAELALPHSRRDPAESAQGAAESRRDPAESWHDPQTLSRRP